MNDGRLTDKERFAKFLIDAEFDRDKFLNIIQRFNLSKLYKNFNYDKDD